jgi:hypothetical protein
MMSWSQVFEGADAEALGLPIECRYPFADIRLVGYLLAIPVVPWCTDKTLIRLALKGVLPDAIRYRKKTPVSRDQLHAALGQAAITGIGGLEPARSLSHYVKGAVATVGRRIDVTTDYADLRPSTLNHWLRYSVENRPEKGDAFKEQKMANDTRSNPDSEVREKKPYQTPTLREHGSVRDITQGTHQGDTRTDNPLSPKNKTGFGD